MATVLLQKRKLKERQGYVVYYNDPHTGRRKYYKSFRRQKDARQAISDLRILLDSGRMPDNKSDRLQLMNFGEVAASVKEEWQVLLQTRMLKEKTVQDYVYFLDLVCLTFADKLLCEITAKDIEKYRAKVASDLSNVSSNKRLGVIKKVFTHGQEIKAIIDNPVKNIKKLSERDHERNRFILPEQLDELIVAARLTKAKYYLPALIYLGAEHGASKQEALSLSWTDIVFDFEGKGIIRFYRTKNHRERTEFLMPRTKQALLEWKDHQMWMRNKKKISRNDSEIVFSHLNGSPIINFNRAWWSALEGAGIENFHFHDLRHTFCSNLILSGAGLKEVKELIGHSDISMTDRYSHLTLSHKSSKQERLAAFYAQTP